MGTPVTLHSELRKLIDTASGGSHKTLTTGYHMVMPSAFGNIGDAWVETKSRDRVFFLSFLPFRSWRLCVKHALSCKAAKNEKDESTIHFLPLNLGLN